MQIRKLSASKIYPIVSAPVEDGVIIVEGTKIVSIDKKTEHDPSSIEQFEGILIPGFVNTHCHLELSHMKAKVDTGTGLIPFISSVVNFRDIEQSIIDQAIVDADQEMIDNGIVAVGDISNKADTAVTKSKSSIDYYTFLEMFDFLNKDMTAGAIEQYGESYRSQSDVGHNKKNYVPHAPYTVTPELFEFIKSNSPKDCTISIHNQETPDENLLFEKKEGKFLDFYEGFQMPLSDFLATGKTAIHYAMNNMDPSQRSLFVHNTMTNTEDIKSAHSWSDKVYWATCPNANLYIENRLPDYKIFIEQNARMTIGTDSLTSNWQLSVLEEMKTINRYQSYVDLDTLLAWATINGAEALGYADRLGSFEPGKSPGINLLYSADPNQFDLQSSRVKKIL